MYILKEADDIALDYNKFVKNIQQYVDDNYNASTIRQIVSYLKNGHERDFRPISFTNKTYRGILYNNLNDSKENIIKKLKTIESKDISITYDIDEARAFAFGSNIYEFSNIKSELKNMHHGDCAIVYKAIVAMREVMIDVPYCLKNNLLSEVSFIEENEIMLYPINHSFVAEEIYFNGQRIL
jgi:hypothetical protein